jgi:hypothetical protein
MPDADAQSGGEQQADPHSEEHVPGQIVLRGSRAAFCRHRRTANGQHQ